MCVGRKKENETTISHLTLVKHKSQILMFRIRLSGKIQEHFQILHLIDLYRWKDQKLHPTSRLEQYLTEHSLNCTDTNQNYFFQQLNEVVIKDQLSSP